MDKYFSNYYQVREWLEGYIPQVYGKEELGLARIEYLLKLLGNPQDKFKSIHIAGTAGKGSTCFYIARLLSEERKANGKWRKVGLHVSPHLVDIRERMQVFQYPISNIQYQISNDGLMPMKRFLRLFNEIKPVVDSMKSCKVGEPSYFEILVAASFKYFAEEKVDFAVVEVGLGGRLDATNVLKPEIAVITNVGLDHTELLGETVEEIAKEKAGIIKKGVPVVTAASGKAFRVIEKVARLASAHLIMVNPVVFGEPRRAKEKDSKVVKVNTRKLPYELSFQPFSDAPFLAIEALRLLKILLRKSVFEKVFSETFAGRFEEIEDGVILDGAHNPDKIKALINFLREFQISLSTRNSLKASNFKFQIALVVAFKKGKAWKKMVDLLVANLPIKMIIATEFNAVTDTGKFSTVPAAEISDYIRRKGVSLTGVYSNSQEAVFEALQSAIDDSRSTIILVTGSLYLVGEVRTMWELPEF